MHMAVIAQSVGDRQEVDRSFVIDDTDDHLVAQVRAGNDAAFEAIDTLEGCSPSARSCWEAGRTPKTRCS
jgi:hypothetical protein